MFSRLRHWLSQAKKNGVRIRFHEYREQLDLTGKPLMLLSRASVESARELIPFLRTHDQMEDRVCATDEIVAYNGEPADEMHAFTRVTQGGSQVTRLLVRGGMVIEVTLKGW